MILRVMDLDILSNLARVNAAACLYDVGADWDWNSSLGGLRRLIMLGRIMRIYSYKASDSSYLSTWYSLSPHDPYGLVQLPVLGPHVQVLSVAQLSERKNISQPQGKPVYLHLPPQIQQHISQKPRPVAKLAATTILK
jgi:hypothetical protein